MPRYPKQPLEEKLAWMRQKQDQKQAEAEVRAEEERRRARLAAGERRPAPPPPLPPPPVIRPAWAARQMLRVDQVAGVLSVSTRTVQRWFADRAIIVQTGPTKTTMLIPEQALDDWFTEHAPKVS
jgi:Helix-turn-helix domain